MPCHHKLEEYLDASIETAGRRGNRKKPPSSTLPSGKAGALTGNARNDEVSVGEVERIRI